MEVKDIVMTEGVNFEHHPDLRGPLEAQAEISFKAGMKPTLKAILKEAQRIRQAKRTGILKMGEGRKPKEDKT